MSYATNTPIQYIPGIGWRTAKIMHELGIHTAGQLNNVPEKMLIELFGPSIRSVIAQLNMPLIARYDAITSSTKKITTKAPTLSKKHFIQRLKLAAQFASVL